MRVCVAVSHCYPDDCGSLIILLLLLLLLFILQTQFPGTHNSHISESYGYGIEAPGFAALLDRPSVDLYPMSGVSQFLSITDQLTIGLRHIE